jgi:phytoene dehydrogenase-like protein
VKNGAVTGVLLGTGEEISANAVISNADPKRTLLKLTDPTHLSPDFVQKLAALPRQWHGRESQPRALGPCQISPR